MTLNLGLRWSRYSPAYANDDHISNYVPSLFNGTNPLSGLVRGDQAGASGLPRGLQVGTEKFLLRNLQEGGKGCITATANVNAPAIVRAWRERTEEAQKRIDVVRNTYENYPMISALKETIARRTGDPQWRAVRPPLVELSDEQRSTLAA